MKKIITFDIETVPCQRAGIREQFAAEVTAPTQYKKADSIAQWLAENREAEAEAEWLKTSFDGGLGQCVCIGFAVDDDPAITYTVADLSPGAEVKMLQDFFSLLTDAGSDALLVGHNLIAFDVPFLWKRAMVLGVKPPFSFPRDPKPWGERVFDTMTHWAGTKDRISMNKLCAILGITDKGGMDGSKVWPLVEAGRIAEVEAYCAGDVERTRAIYRRMTFAEPVASKPVLRVVAPVAAPAAKPAVELAAADF